MMDARTPSLLHSYERRVSYVVNGLVQIIFHQPPGRVRGCCCLRSNGSQQHCQQYHLTIVAYESLPLVHSMAHGQRASNDDVIVGECWELRDLVVDHPVGLLDDDKEE